jgi:hypothetical protein
VSNLTKPPSLFITEHSAHYDNNPSFSDFRSFGGWSRPAIKQYHGTAYECGAGIDKNWY